MEKVVAELGFFDVIAYFIPGALTVLVIAYVVWVFQPQAFARFQRLPSSLNTIIFIIAAYVAGHLIVIMASNIERSFHAVDGRFSVQLLEPDNDRLEAQYRKRLLEQIDLTFGVGYRRYLDAQGRWRSNAYDLFALCYAYTITKRIDSHIQIMNARYHFFLGLSLAFAISALLIALAAAHCRNEGRMAEFNACAVCVLALVVGVWLTWDRARKFDREFVYSVYHAFYVDAKE